MIADGTISFPGNLGARVPEGELMASADDYRRHAAECIRLARNIENQRDKALLLAMADAWRRLAKQAEDRESGDPSR